MGLQKTQLDNYSNNTQTSTQLYIIRQSQVERSIEFYNLHNIKPTPAELLRTAELLKDYVLHGTSLEVMERASLLDQHINKKYKKVFTEDK
jgi:hypothetical protein